MAEVSIGGRRSMIPRDATIEVQSIMTKTTVISAASISLPGHRQWTSLFTSTSPNISAITTGGSCRNPIMMTCVTSSA